MELHGALNQGRLEGIPEEENHPRAFDVKHLFIE